MLARLQSIRSCACRRVSIAWCNCSPTPEVFQSRRRLQQVIPRLYKKRLGKLFTCNAFWQYEHDAVKPASLLAASWCAPPLAEGTKAGIRGCGCRQSSLLTGRRAMRAASITGLKALYGSRVRHSSRWPARGEPPPPTRCPDSDNARLTGGNEGYA